MESERWPESKRVFTLAGTERGSADLRDSADDTKRTAIVADLMSHHRGEPSEFELQMWIRWADMVLFALDEYRTQGRDEIVEMLEQFVRFVTERADESCLETARRHLARHITAGRPSMSQEDARKLLRTDPSGNPYPTDV